MLTVVPSNRYTRRPRHSHPGSARASRARPTAHAAAEKNASGSRCRARQSAPVRVEPLAEEPPEGDERGEDPVQPPADDGQGVRQDVLGQDVGEWQAPALEE